MITIRQEQINEATEWEQRLAEGGCNLNDALFMCMASGAPISVYMRQMFDQAISRYNDGEFDDLAEAFGIAMSKRSKQAIQKWDLQRKVYTVVELYGEQGFAKTNPSHYDNTAFHKAAEAFNKSPSHIYDRYREACKQLR